MTATMVASELGATDAIAKIRMGELSCEEYCIRHLDRIAERDGDVGAWEWVDTKQAITRAKELDAGPRSASLCGLTIGIKDVIDTADMPTGYGTPIYANNRPAADAACVVALRRAGANIIGKTVTTEFAYSNPSKTRNPLDPSRTPGGSSSGSAAAVADYMAAATLGTQTVGSIIRPASYCGVVGYKPSFNLINRSGLKICAESFDTIGVITKTVTDAALLTSVMAERPKIAASRLLSKPPNVTFCRTHHWNEAEPSTRNALKRAVSAFKKAGAVVREVELPDSFSGIVDAHLKIMATETVRALSYELETSGALISKKMWEVLELADVGTSDGYDQALGYLSQCRHYAKTSLFKSLGECDVILAPSVPGEAPRDLSTTGNPIFNFVWTALHLPCLTIPGFKGADRMPVGVQLIGRYFDDARLLRIGEWAERAIAQDAEQ